MNKMLSSGVLSTLNPVSLQRKVFVDIGIHCGRRGREGWRELRKDSFVKKSDSEGRVYYTLCYNEFDKNHRESEIKDQRIYAIPNNPHCPVHSLDLYLSKLHPENPALFQRPDPKYMHKTHWYHNAPLGVHTLENMLSNILKEAKLSKVYTNHSLNIFVPNYIPHE